MAEKVYDYEGNELDLMIYFVLFPQNAKFFKKRLVKVCESFNGEKYTLPDSKTEIKDRLKKAISNINEIYKTIAFTTRNFEDYLKEVH